MFWCAVIASGSQQALSLLGQHQPKMQPVSDGGAVVAPDDLWSTLALLLLLLPLCVACCRLVSADTYEQFVESNEELLKELPPPMVAAAYYRNADLYMVSPPGPQDRTSRRAFPLSRYLHLFAHLAT
jgi:hypothetical protein